MNFKEEKLKRIYYAVEIAELLMEEFADDLGKVIGHEKTEWELRKILRNMEIVSVDMLDLLERESE